MALLGLERDDSRPVRVLENQTSSSSSSSLRQQQFPASLPDFPALHCTILMCMHYCSAIYTALSLTLHQQSIAYCQENSPLSAICNCFNVSGESEEDGVIRGSDGRPVAQWMVGGGADCYSVPHPAQLAGTRSHVFTTGPDRQTTGNNTTIVLRYSM